MNSAKLHLWAFVLMIFPLSAHSQSPSCCTEQEGRIVRSTEIFPRLNEESLATLGSQHPLLAHLSSWVSASMAYHGASPRSMNFDRRMLASFSLDKYGPRAIIDGYSGRANWPDPDTVNQTGVIAMEFDIQQRFQRSGAWVLTAIPRGQASKAAYAAYGAVIDIVFVPGSGGELVWSPNASADQR